jgi:hypothetical protein
MGNWYTNISLRGTKQGDAAAALEALGRRAYVTPEKDGWIVVYDRQCDEFDLNALESLALTLSTRLACTALASFNADDDVLWLGVWENGVLATRYASSLREFEDGDEFPSLEESAQVLARVFGKPETSRQVLGILRKSHGALGLLSLFFKMRFAYVTEIERHQDLAGILGMPRASIGLGFQYVDRGETPDDMERAALRLTLGA